jgi:hypothetical protein
MLREFPQIAKKNAEKRLVPNARLRPSLRFHASFFYELSTNNPKPGQGPANPGSFDHTDKPKPDSQV